MTMPGMIDSKTLRNTHKAEQEKKIMKTRKTLRRQRRNRYIGYALAAVVGLGVGTALVNVTEADAATQAQINRFIRSEHGIPPCKWEDGSGTPGVPEKAACYWNDGSGWAFIAVADGRDKDDDKDIVYLTGPKAVRY